MYRTDVFIASKCMHVLHSGGLGICTLEDKYTKYDM